MKKFKLNPITPLLLIFMLQGCMPDSLTKFNKDTPTAKPTATTAAPVLPGGGTLAYPTATTFSFTEENSVVAVPSKDLEVGTIEKLDPGLSNAALFGSLSDPTKSGFLFVKCSLNTTGTILTQSLPPGMSLNANSCKLVGTPTIPYFDITPPLIVPTNITYTVDLLYKGPTYTGPGTESKITGTIALGSYFFDSSGVKDTVAIDYPAIAPAGFSYTQTIAGVITPITSKTMAVGTTIEFDPKTVGAVGAPDGVGGTLSNPLRSHYIFERCSLDTSGPLSTRALPPGLILHGDTCLITGTPTADFTDTTFGNMGGIVTYKIDLFYKGPTYLGPGTEVKVTTILKLMSTSLDPATFVAPTALSYEHDLGVPVAAANFEINLQNKYGPKLDGTLINPDKFALAFVDCALDATTPTLPPGVILNPATCSLVGTPAALPILPILNPSSYKVNLRYKNPAIYTGPGTESTVSGIIPVGIYYKPTLLTYSQHDKLQFHVDKTVGLDTNTDTTTASTAYVRAGLITSSNGITGVIKFFDSSTNNIGIVRVIPLKLGAGEAAAFSLDQFIVNAAGATGKIESINTVTDTIYIERINPAVNFAPGIIHGYAAAGTPFATGGSINATVASIDSNYAFDIAVTSLDNDEQFFSGKYSQSGNITAVYEKGVSIPPITPNASAQITAQNNLTYSISPALPAGLNFSTTTGIISGSFTNVLDSTRFTITATNPLGSTTFPMFLSAIIGPSDLSVSNNQIITVNSNALFKEGETIIQPLLPPLTVALRAKILKRIGNYQLAIETSNGVFSPGASLDNNSTLYKSEKAFIIPYNTCVNSNYTTKATCEAAGFAFAPKSAVHYNLAITTSNSGSYLAGNYISAVAGTGSGAKGLVVSVVTAAKDILFVQYLTQAATSTATAKTFYEGDTLDLGGSSVDQIEQSSMKITLSAPAIIPTDWQIGSDVVTSAPAKTAAYTYDVNGNDLYLNEISKTSAGTSFKTLQTVNNNETVASATVSKTISAVTHTNHLVFERGNLIYFNGNLSAGTGVIYSITPALPNGVNLNPLTGAISGTATSAMFKKDFVLSAQNFVGAVNYVFSLEVKDYFQIQDNSDASSFLLHKVGDNEVNRKCRIDSKDTANGTNGKALDIRCFLDGEEQDIYSNDLKLQVSAGSGVCEYIQYNPYFFNSWSPIKSFQISSKYKSEAIVVVGCTALNSSGTIPTADQCDGNYSVDDPSYPNCDDGRLSYLTRTYTQAAAVAPAEVGECTLVSSVRTYVNCGGSKSKCVAGPVKDIVDDAGINAGKRSQIISTSAGLSKVYTHTSPISHSDGVNIRIANGNVSSTLTSSAADTASWVTAVKSRSKLGTPMGSDSNPFYSFSCLDAAMDVKARIRVIVRDWDRAFRIDDGIDNQNPLPGIAAAKMNAAGIDPIFNSPYNDLADWDDDYTGLATPPAFTAGSGLHAANATTVDGIFTTDQQCTEVSGSVTFPGASAFCSNGAFTDKFSCITAGTCSNPAFTTKISCVAQGSCADPTKLTQTACLAAPSVWTSAGNTWTAEVWTPAKCLFDSEYMTELYGTPWVNPDHDFFFPNSKLYDTHMMGPN